MVIPLHFPFVKLDAFGPQSKTSSTIIRGFKIGVTKNALMIVKDFIWDSRFPDHNIRNDEA
ncbi:MAG: hypothetical protein ACOH2V_01585 [Candidatus Saccharimonadaceae bacterium]